MKHGATAVYSEKQAAVHWLIEQFPAAFFASAKQVKPLKLGIFEDLLDFYERLDYPPLSKKSLREALNYYSSSKAYLQSQVEGAYRIDLFGQHFEEVTTEQALYAKQQLSERRANAKNDKPSDS